MHNRGATAQDIQRELIFRYGILSPNKTDSILLGEKLRHFEMFFHGVPSN